MEKKLYELTVDEELLKVAPPLSENERRILTEDILEHGCQFPLIVWGKTIVDGHNRYSICTENGIPFAIEEMEFDSLTDAKIWIVKNQLGRRNLTEFQRCELIYPFEKEFKEQAEKRRVALRASGVPTLAHEKKTRDVMADLADVSHGTWDKAKKILADGDEDIKTRLRSGEMKIHTAYTQLKKKEKPVEEPEEKPKPDAGPGEEKPPVVAAYLDHSIPFEPVQRDATPDELEDEFDELMDGWRDDMEVLLGRLTEENTTEELRTALHTKLTAFYTEMTKAIGGMTNE